MYENGSCEHAGSYVVRFEIIAKCVIISTMKPKHSFVVRSIRSVVRDHEDLPALHAGFLVFSFLAAALFRLGFFALLIIVRMVLDIVKEREVFHRSWGKTAESVVRSSLPDISLLTFGFAFAMLLHPLLPPVSFATGFTLAVFTLSRGMGVTLPKLKILFDLLRVFFHMESYLGAKNTVVGKPLVFAERVSLLLLISSLAALILLPFMLQMSVSEYLSLLLAQCVPWRM